MRVVFFKILGLLIGVIAISCDQFSRDDCETELGNIVTKIIVLDSIKVVEPQIINVKVSVGDEQRVIARGHRRVIDALNTKVIGGVWSVNFAGQACYLDYQLELEVTISKNNTSPIPSLSL